MSTKTKNEITITEAGNASFDCPVCGWSAGMAGSSDDFEDDLEVAEHFYQSVEAHREEHAAEPRPRAVDDQVVIPLAVYSEPWGHQPGTVVVCAACPGRSWFPRSKHGTQLLQEAIDKHIGHTRQDKTHD